MSFLQCYLESSSTGRQKFFWLALKNKLHAGEILVEKGWAVHVGCPSMLVPKPPLIYSSNALSQKASGVLFRYVPL